MCKKRGLVSAGYGTLSKIWLPLSVFGGTLPTVLWTFLIGTERNLGFPTEPSVETPERVAEEEAKAVEET